jgi:hypothetical protein
LYQYTTSAKGYYTDTQRINIFEPQKELSIILKSGFPYIAKFRKKKNKSTAYSIIFATSLIAEYLLNYKDLQAPTTCFLLISIASKRYYAKKLNNLETELDLK